MRRDIDSSKITIIKAGDFAKAAAAPAPAKETSPKEEKK